MKKVTQLCYVIVSLVLLFAYVQAVMPSWIDHPHPLSIMVAPIIGICWTLLVQIFGRQFWPEDYFNATLPKSA